MGKSAPKPPPTPDPAALAAAQGTANKEAVLESARVNQINEVTPYGNLTYTGAIGGPDRTRTTSLTPEAQAIYNLQQGISGELTDFGGAQARRVGETLAQPFSFASLGARPQADDASRQRIEQAIFARQEPLFARDEAALQSRLANQGITQGSEAYRNAQDDFSRAKNDARLSAVISGGQEQSRQFGLESAARNQGISELQALRAQPVNELAALLQGAPALGSPQFAGAAQYNVGAGDVLGANALSQSAQQNAYNQRVASQNAAFGGLAGLGGALGSAAILSDRRLKHDIRRVGVTDGGVPIYTFRYNGSLAVHMGVMADEVERFDPSAVIEIGGFKHVDYAKVA